MNEILQLILFVYALGLAFFAGIVVGDRSKPSLVEIPLVLVWPVSVPVARTLYFWQHGLLVRRFRYMDMHWWQRGELVSRREGLTYKEWLPK